MTENHKSIVTVSVDRKKKQFYILCKDGFDLMVTGKDFDKLLKEINLEMKAFIWGKDFASKSDVKKILKKLIEVYY